MDCHHCCQSFKNEGTLTRHVRKYHPAELEAEMWRHVERMQRTERLAAGQGDGDLAYYGLSSDSDGNGRYNFIEHAEVDTRYEPRSETPDSNSSVDVLDEADGEIHPVQSEEEFDNPIGLVRDQLHGTDCVSTNRYAPFQTREDYVIAWWSHLHPRISKSRMDKLLAIVHDPNFDFKNTTFSSANSIANITRKMIASEAIVSWETAAVAIKWPENDEWNGYIVEFAYRNVRKLIESLLSRNNLGIVLKPHVTRDVDGNKLYNEAWTGERWTRMQVGMTFSCCRARNHI
jgi:hypothetical protein